MLAEQRRLVGRWDTSAEAAIAAVRARGTGAVRQAPRVRRDALMTEFREANARYQDAVSAQARRDFDRATLIATVVVGLLVLIIGVAGVARVRAVRRRDREEEEHHRVRERTELAVAERARRFARVLQMAESEPDAEAVIVRHIEREIPGSSATVLVHDPRTNRLEAVGRSEAPPGLEAALDQAPARSCVALRRGEAHQSPADAPDLVQCEICGGLPGRPACAPITAGTRALGALLVTRDEALTDADRRLLDETVVVAGPVLANLRTLATAQANALTDPLTGLANRRALDGAFARMLAHATRTAAQFSLVLLDLDHFKLVNDRYGHDRGDEVLAGIAHLLGSTARKSDLPARFGGEEFLVLLPDTDAPGAAAVAEKFRTAMELLSFPGVQAPVTGSFGVATFPQDGTSMDSLLHGADLALYEAKKAGRNCVRSASSSRPSPSPAG